VVAMFNVSMIGHVNPTFPLVMELVGRGCKVHYFLPPNEDIRSAARDAGAFVEAYLEDDPQDFVLEHCGVDRMIPDLPEEEQQLWRGAVWPLASTLLCGDHLITRCRALGIQAVLYDPMAPHGLLVAHALRVPCVSLVTYPGMGSLAGLMKDEQRLRFAMETREEYGQRIKERFDVDMQDQMLSRRQYFASENFITTSDDLVVPLPAPGEKRWADEFRGEHFRFEAVGCMVSKSAPHVAMARAAPSETALLLDFGSDLPVHELESAKARGDKIVYCALGTMALASRWNMDLGMYSAGNLPAGTTGKEFCQHVWRALLAALDFLGPGFHCVISAGTQLDALDFLPGGVGQLPANATVRSSVPQVEMLHSYADVFISHAGFNSLQESVFEGVPMIAVPQAVDQPANARKVEASGWGRAFLEPMSSVTAESLVEALREITSNTSAASIHAKLEASRAKLRGGEMRAADRLLDFAAGGGA